VTYSLSQSLGANGYATVSWDSSVPINDTMTAFNAYSIPNNTTVPSDNNSGGGNTQDSIVLRIVLFCLAALIFFAVLVLAYFGVFSFLRSPWASRQADEVSDADAVDAAYTKTTAETSGKDQVPA